MLLAVLTSICVFVYLVDRARVRRQLSAVSQSVVALGALATATAERLDAASGRLDAQGLRMSENERLAEFNVRRVNIALDRIETKVGRVR
jgi:hypothetical protein